MVPESVYSAEGFPVPEASAAPAEPPVASPVQYAVDSAQAIVAGPEEAVLKGNDSGGTSEDRRVDEEAAQLVLTAEDASQVQLLEQYFVLSTLGIIMTLCMARNYEGRAIESVARSHRRPSATAALWTRSHMATLPPQLPQPLPRSCQQQLHLQNPMLIKLWVSPYRLCP